MAGKSVAVIGGGPSGLMAAEVLARSGLEVTVYEAMPTPARKFLMAGKSGLNITHSEEYLNFVKRFGTSTSNLRAALDAFTPNDLVIWANGLDQETFIGTSGRVFPKAMKGSPLLRAWLSRLEEMGVHIKTRHKWVGFSDDHLQFETPQGPLLVKPDACLVALGGASWPRLGSDAAWVPYLQNKGVRTNVFRPANCGFERVWSDYFIEKFAGEPIKSVSATSAAGQFEGEFVVTKYGVEGSLVYQHSSALRNEIELFGKATLYLDLAPGRTKQRLQNDLEKTKSKDSFSNKFRKAAALSPVKIALLREIVPNVVSLNPPDLVSAIKNVKLTLDNTRHISEAISVAGGIDWSELDENYMLRKCAGIFAAGEMIDWEAPTGGYLLTASFATGRSAAHGIVQWLASNNHE